MIDVHCHLEWRDFDPDREAVIAACRKEMDAIITSAADPKDYPFTLKLAQQHKNFVFPSLGLHPTEAVKLSGKAIEAALETIREHKKKVVAIGEVGLDYHYIKEEPQIKKSKDIFIQFIQLAQELKKPLVIHSRESNPDVFKLLSDYDAKTVVLHCFGDKNNLPFVLEQGWYLSIATIIATSKNHRKIVRQAPLEKLLTETDAPWLAPGRGRNTPLGTRLVLEKIAKERNIPLQMADDVTTHTTRSLFSLPLKEKKEFPI